MIKGFGGIFWRTKNLEVIKKWYSEVLKIEIDFPTEQQVMLNFQVHNLDETIKHFEHIGIPLAKKKEISEFGKFVWIEDPEGRLIELWEK
ncbi:VOC family protein [Paenibacillus pseudetheri]|uniref:Glyoxalase n=1 Tax=Paenibacillus pseudetheri TaxID=2897682 RepID=A0ABM9BCY9_9BACL|nr:glyoxalase [Paenibacillus pseudetheri]CAH1056292.1 hypothetical protein PAECIP111894_02445 [Paenibacillus pseudetheri]